MLEFCIFLLLHYQLIALVEKMVGVSESSGTNSKELSQLATAKLTKLRGCFYIFHNIKYFRKLILHLVNKILIVVV
jgi:hypothetical protein